MSNPLPSCIAAINTVADHVYAFRFILIGVGLVCAGHKDTGELIVGAGLAVFRVPSASPE